MLVAIVCGTIAAVGVNQWMKANTGGNAEMVEIYVTSQAISALEEITPEKLQLEQWPADRAPSDAIREIKDIEGKFAKHSLYKGEPVLTMKLVADQDHVPTGYTVVNLKAARNTVISLFSHGDRVDVSAYFEKSDLFPRSTQKDILSGVRVYAIDGEKYLPEEDDKKKKPRRSPNEVSLLIRKADQEAWTYATRLGDVELNLGGAPGYETPGKGMERSPKADAYLTWMDELYEAQKARDFVPEPVTNSGQPKLAKPQPKKNTFTVVKMVDGRMVKYEFTEGEELPKITGDTSTPSVGVAADADAAATLEQDDYLSGQDSPFYQPEGEEDEVPTFGTPRDNRN